MTLAQQCSYRACAQSPFYETARKKLQDYIHKALTDMFVSQNNDELIDTPEIRELKQSHIRKYIRESKTSYPEYTEDQLVRKLYYDLTFSVLYEPLFLDNRVEKINCNSWKDIYVTFVDGSKCKINGFSSKSMALDVARRLVERSQGMDASFPARECELTSNIRVTAMQFPIHDEEKMVSFSIRKLNPKGFTREEYIENGFISAEAFDFLATCLECGIPVLVAGKVGTGKTLMINALLHHVSKRKFIIESGAREINVDILNEEGEIISDAVYALSRPSTADAQENITQEFLVAKALRYDADVLVVSEMRDTEAYAAQEAANTGSTVISSLHSGGAEDAHERVADLCRKKYPIDYSIALVKAAKAFPVVAFLLQGKDHVRRCTEISEAVVTGTQIAYSSLYRFNVVKNTRHEGKYHVDGQHQKINAPSNRLVDRMIVYGATEADLKRIGISHSAADMENTV